MLCFFFLTTAEIIVFDHSDTSVFAYFARIALQGPLMYSFPYTGLFAVEKRFVQTFLFPDKK